jgi:hypothetical protein
MSKKFPAFLLLIAFAATADLAVADVGLEVHAREIVMPVKDTGSISYKQCDRCKEMSLRTTAATSYEIGDVPVRRETLRAELLSRPGQVMLLQLTQDRKNVARIKISAATE